MTSKPDDIIANAIGRVPHDGFDDLRYIKDKDLKDKLKALMLELVGEYKDYIWTSKYEELCKSINDL